MSFPINTGIPAAPNNPADDQPIMRQNYANISGFLAIDHVAPGAVNDGYHQQVHLLNEAAPGLGTASGVLYANIATGQSWPFWQNALGSFQLMGQNSISANGFVTIPGGLILQWGSTTAVASSSSTTITFPLAFPNNVFSVQATIVTNDNSTIRFSLLNNASTTGFVTTQTNSSHFTNLYWFAVGN